MSVSKVAEWARRKYSAIVELAEVGVKKERDCLRGRRERCQSREVMGTPQDDLGNIEV